MQWSLLKKAIFAEISLFAAVKSPFYSVPVSAFLFPAPTKLVFCQSAVSRETISKMAADFPAQCVIAILSSRCFPLFGTPYSLAGLFQNGRRTMTRQSLIYTFRVFLLSNLFHVKHSAKTPPNGAGWRFLHFKCVSRKTFSKNSPPQTCLSMLENGFV